MQRVMVGAPVRNRAWILERYLVGLTAQESADASLQYAYVINDSTDETEPMLQRFAAEHSGQADLIRHDLGARATKGHERGQYRYAQIAEVRNRLLLHFLHSEAEWLFSVDTDVLLPARALSALLGTGRRCVSALIPNADPSLPGGTPCNIMWRKLDGTYEHLLRIPPRGRVMSVDLTGSVMLIHRSVVEAGARWGDHPQGEDAVFCQGAQAAGVGVACHTGVRPWHAMGPDRIWRME